jgi:hypothetical protein
MKRPAAAMKRPAAAMKRPASAKKRPAAAMKRPAAHGDHGHTLATATGVVKKRRKRKYKKDTRKGDRHKKGPYAYHM